MKKILFSIYTLSFFTVLQAQQLDRSIRPAPGPAPEIKWGDAESFTLANGLKVFVVENHKLPVVTYSIQLDIKPEIEGRKAGLQSFVGELITSGTARRSKDQFDNEVDLIAADIGANSQSIYGRSLTKYQDRLLDLMSDALLNAKFDQAELDKLKKQSLSGLEVSKNDPDAMMSNVSNVQNFGPKHPYGAVLTESSIHQITLEDCNDYYKKYFRPNVAYMAIVGDIDLAKAKELAEKYFGNWQKGIVPIVAYPAVAAPATNQVDFVPRDGAVQSVVKITYPIDLMIGTPDVIKTRVLNQVLGGSFQRLDRNLRETHAWTYGANSSINPDEIAGHVAVSVKCRNEVTDSAITEMLSEMNAMRNTPLSTEELNGAVRFLSGVFALGLEDPQTIAQYAINMERFNMPKDYYKNYLKRLSAVSVADIQGAAQQYLKTENAHIIVVGNKSEVAKLKKFAPTEAVNFFDNYGNPIQPVISKMIDGVGTEQVLDKYIAGIGGRSAIEGLKDLSISMTMKQGPNDLLISSVIASPNKMKQTLFAGDKIMQKMVINGETGYMEAGSQKQVMPAEAISEYKADADLQQILHPAKYGISYELLGVEKMDGLEVYNVQKISHDGKKRTVQYYDKGTGLLVKEISNIDRGGQPVVEIKSFSNYKEVKNGNGFKIPFRIDSMDGSSITVNSAKANTEIKENSFK